MIKYIKVLKHKLCNVNFIQNIYAQAAKNSELYVKIKHVSSYKVKTLSQVLPFT